MDKAVLLTLKEANEIIIGAAAWLEKSDQKLVAKGLRDWVEKKGKVVVHSANMQLLEEANSNETTTG